jgi:hypothetical protein
MVKDFAFNRRQALLVWRFTRRLDLDKFMIPIDIFRPSPNSNLNIYVHINNCSCFQLDILPLVPKIIYKSHNYASTLCCLIMKHFEHENHPLFFPNQIILMARNLYRTIKNINLKKKSVLRYDTS